MLYRWADHQVFPAKDGAILFGVDEASIFSIDGRTREVLLRRGKGRTLDLSHAYPGERKILKKLRDIRMLVEVGVPAGEPPTLPDPGEIQLETMVLEVAQDCNLRCRYCYAEGGTYGKIPLLLEPEIARRAVRCLVKESGTRRTVTLILFGGEPLLNMEAIRAVVEEAEEQGRETGKKVFLSITTNGTLLTPNIAAFLKQHRIAVSVSIDGPADLHDANRRDERGKGSYERAVASLPALLDGNCAPVAARVTLAPDQWERIEEVFDHVLGLGFHEVGISPASPIHRALLPDPGEEEDLFRGFASLTERFVREAREGRVLPFTNIIDLLARLHAGATRSISCGAGLGYLAVDAGGRFYLCHRLTGEETFCVGSLAEGADFKKIRKVLESVTAGNESLCQACWARTLCGGGCHYENHLRESRLGLAPGSSCGFVRRWLQHGIETYAKLRDEGGDAVLRLFEKRAGC